MGLIRINNRRWFGLIKFLSGIFSIEFTEHNQARGRYGGATAFFTQEQAKEIAVKTGCKRGYTKIHRAMWQAGLSNWQVIADMLNENGKGFLTLTEIKNVGKATAIEIVHFGLSKDLLWFEN